MKKLIFGLIAFFALNVNAQQGTQYVPANPMQTRLNVTVNGFNRWVLFQDLVRYAEDPTSTYRVYKNGNLITAEPRTGTGLARFEGTDAYTVIQNAIDAVQTLPLQGSISVSDGTFTLSNELTFTGKDTAFDPKAQVRIQGVGYATVFVQNTSGKNAFVFKNKISAVLKNMRIDVGALGKSAILADDNGSAVGFGEISIYEGIIENVKVNHSGTDIALHIKNPFNLQVTHIDGISTTQDAMVLRGTSPTGQNYGNSNVSFIHLTAPAGKASLSLISDVPNHPINQLQFSNLSIGFGGTGLYMRGAAYNSFSHADIEYVPNNIVIANGASGVNSGGNHFTNMYLYTNVGGTAINVGSNSFGNDFHGRIESDDATLTVVNDLQQFQAANLYNIVTGYSIGANPTVNITTQAQTPFMMRKVFDGITVMRGPSVPLVLTNLTQSIKFNAGLTYDIGDATNRVNNFYVQNNRAQTYLSLGGAFIASSGSTGSGVEFYINNTGTKVGQFSPTSGNFIAQLGGTFTDNGAKIQTTSLSTANTATKTANYTILASDYTVKGNTTAGAFNITLPTAVGKTGQTFVIKQIGTANTLTVATTSSQTIDGATTYALATQYSFVIVQSNGANWDIIGKG